MLGKVANRAMTLGLSGLCAGMLLFTSVAPVFAEDWHDEHGHEGRGHEERGREARHEFREHDVRHFDRFELGLWSAGGWRHEWHNGRLGWWWMVGGVWYFYEQPVYPYPVVVSGIAFADPVYATPPVVVMPGAPPVVVQQPPPPPQPQMWYYCDNPAGYYPTVATCSTPFRAVPAQPR